MRWSIPVVLALLVFWPAGAAVGPAAAAGTATLTVALETPGGDPVGGAEITANWSSDSTTATTAANGKAFIDVPDNAEVTISVSHPNYVRNNPYVVSNAETEDVPITVYEKARVTFRITGGGGPVEGATVRLRKGGTQAVGGQTDADGRWRTGVIESGEYVVGVYKAGFYRLQTEVTVEDGDTVPLGLDRGFVTLEVVVRDDHFDQPRPVNEAEVIISGLGTIITQQNGRQRIDAPVNSQFEVTVEKQGYRTVTQDINVLESDKTVQIDTQRAPKMELRPLNERVVVGETVIIEATDEYGDPIRNATVWVNDNEIAPTNDEGRTSVRIGSPGEYDLRAKKGSREDTTSVTGIAAPETDETESPPPTTTAGETTTEAPLGQAGFGALVAVIAIMTVLAFALGRTRLN